MKSLTTEDAETRLRSADIIASRWLFANPSLHSLSAQKRPRRRLICRQVDMVTHWGPAVAERLPIYR
jgi:hypothetical protein